MLCAFFLVRKLLFIIHGNMFCIKSKQIWRLVTAGIVLVLVYVYNCWYIVILENKDIL